jgi:2-keto-4-pentenoate hydratase/2-oxohepta-3-ene-1,7-dioic acid hydratase in catechol pathway
MKYCRFKLGDKTRHGLIETVDGQEMISCMLGVPPSETDPWGTIIPDFIPPERIPLAEARLLAPVHPHKIVCVGRNYREHAKELDNEVPTEPLIFLKPPSSIIGPSSDIRLPEISERVDFEGELGVIIRKTCRKLRDDQDVRPFIFGYTCANDVTARDLQKKDKQWTRAKGFDTFCPVGPIVTDEIDPRSGSGLRLQTLVNGEVRQDGNTRDMIFPLDRVIRYISRVMTLFPFDLICTGTPAGVGQLKKDDVVAVKIEGIGTLSNHVIED